MEEIRTYNMQLGCLTEKVLTDIVWVVDQVMRQEAVTIGIQSTIWGYSYIVCLIRQDQSR